MKESCPECNKNPVEILINKITLPIKDIIITADCKTYKCKLCSYEWITQKMLEENIEIIRREIKELKA